MSKSYEKYRIVEGGSPKSYEKYMVKEDVEPIIEDTSPSNAEIVGKSLASGVISNLDIPQNVATLLERFGANPEYGIYGQGRKLYNYLSGTPHEELPSPKILQSLPENIASGLVKKGIKGGTGIDLTPKPQGGGQRILSHAAEFAGGLGPMGLINKGGKALNTAKALGLGSTIGATSGAAQEMGANPLAADIGASLVMPAAVAGSKNILNKFTKAHRDNKVKGKVAAAIKGQIGEENVPEVLKNIDAYKRERGPIDLQLTTPEIAGDVGLSRIYRTQSNSEKLPRRYAENDVKLREALESLGITGMEEGVKGEAIRAPFVEKFAKDKQLREQLTKPLYEQLEALEEGLNPKTAKALLEKELSVSSPSNKAPLEKYLKGLQRNDVNPLNVEKIKELKNNLKTVERDYKDLNPTALKELTAPIIKEIGQLEGALLPRPIQIENTIQELGDKVNALTRTGEMNAARKYGGIKKAYEEDLAKSPVGLKHREEYKRLSKPLSEIETSPLLKNLVKKNTDVSKLEGFSLPSEKVPTAILSADVPNTKLLMKKASSDPELLKLIKGVYIDKLLETSTLSSGNLSYDRANKFLNNKYTKEKINSVFNKQEKRILDQYLDTLKRRSKVETQGKVSGSDTHQKFKIDEELNRSLGLFGNFAKKSLSSATGTGRLGDIVVDTGEKIINKLGKNKYNLLLEEALLDPNAFRELMTDPAKLKKFGDFYQPIPSLIEALNSRSRQEK